MTKRTLHLSTFGEKMSNMTLYQTKIASRISKFIPTPKNNSIQLTCDLQTFANKLGLTEYFEDHNVTPK